MSRILVTGATGFIGKATVQRLSSDNNKCVVAAVRQGGLLWPERVVEYVTGDLQLSTDGLVTLKGVSVIVHCAARAHVMIDSDIDPEEEFRRVNATATLALARKAALSDVQRFVFISSIGVNGTETFQHPFSAQDNASPMSPYAVSKYEAELGLLELARETGMEVVIIRPPLVYGPGAPGNFGLLVHWLQCGVPLPLGAIYNKRSLVALDNLVDLIVTCLTHSSAANQTFLVSDDEDLSTTQLLRRMGAALGKPVRLIPVPASLLKLCAKLAGKPELAQRLCGSLQVDISKTKKLLGWRPPFSVNAGLKKAAEGYICEKTV